jgi:hypothetical protein
VGCHAEVEKEFRDFIFNLLTLRINALARFASMHDNMGAYTRASIIV